MNLCKAVEWGFLSFVILCCLGLLGGLVVFFGMILYLMYQDSPVFSVVLGTVFGGTIFSAFVAGLLHKD